ERLAVVELHALAKLDLHCVLVERRQRFREFEHQFVRLFRPHRRTGEVAEDEAFDDQLAEVGVRRRVPVAGQRLGAEKPHWAVFGGEGGIEQEIRVDPAKSESARANQGASHEISSIDHCLACPPAKPWAVARALYY